MSQTVAYSNTATYGSDAVLKLDPQRRADLGQYMTPAPIARFMASLFTNVSGDMRILDPGAGVGSLTAALVERICNESPKPQSAFIAACEIEQLLTTYLQRTLNDVQLRCESAQIRTSVHLYTDDFILTHPDTATVQGDVFPTQHLTDGEFSHVIMNPPYKKVNSSSLYRRTLRRAGIETSNLYSAFMALAVQRLCKGGEMVAIVPRSFCNGPYFKAFRNRFFSDMTFQHIHVFEKRNSAFKTDEVLQENIIIHAVKGNNPSDVTITTSRGSSFETGKNWRKYIGENMTQHSVSYDAVIHPGDPNCFLHIITSDVEQSIVNRIAHFTTSLAELGLCVSTGPVVDFRLKDDLRFEPGPDTAPLLYSSHFRGEKLEWPKTMKKPNAIRISDQSRKWLWKNDGHFVVTRRFSAKEERRRIVASIYPSCLSGSLIGFENHLNVFHTNQTGMSEFLAKGLSIYLNSTLVDRYFRQFNGHTQVNATDLRSLRYPRKDTLERFGKISKDKVLSQQEVDDIVERETAHNPTTKTH